MRYYYFNKPLGPTEINLSQTMKALGWQQSEEKAEFTEANLMSDNTLACFEHKHKLNYWLVKHGLSFAPKTVILDELSLHLTLESLSQEDLNHAWILKPALLNNGHGIRIFSDISQVKNYFRQSERYSGIHVLQKYIDPPQLIDNKKFSLRVFVVLSSNKEVYVHSEGYINVCQAPYFAKDLTQLGSHLTNEHLNADGSTNNQQVMTSNWPLFKNIFPEVERQCQALFTPLFSNNLAPNTYGILGVDFMLDINHRLWLLEVNHGPCFPTNNQHPLFKPLYQPFWQTIINNKIFDAF